MSRSRSLGTSWEREFVKWWNSHPNVPKIRRQDSPWSPNGDIQGLDGWVLELKNVVRKDLGTHMTQAATSAERMKAENYAVVYKKRGSNPDEAQIVLPARVFIQLYQLAQKGLKVTDVERDGTGDPGRIHPSEEDSNRRAA